MKVLVTGGSGFVGARLVARLAAEGCLVRATCRQHGIPPAAGVEVWPLESLEDETILEQAAAGCDSVIHLAALAHQRGSAADRTAEFMRVNAEGTRRLARASARAGVRRFIFVSSIAAVCTRSEAPVDEQTPCAPTDPYGGSKLAAEAAVLTELQGPGTDWCILRPPLIYGPDNPGNMQRLLGLIATGWPLPFASIHNCRSFAFIDNLVDALVAVLEHERQVRAIFVFGDGSDLSTPQLITALARAGGVRPHLWPLPLPILSLTWGEWGMPFRSSAASLWTQYRLSRSTRRIAARRWTPVSRKLFLAPSGQCRRGTEKNRRDSARASHSKRRGGIALQAGMSWSIWLTASGALVLAAVLTGVIRRVALRHGLIDVPNARSSHQAATPRGGGLAIVVSVMLGLLLLRGIGVVGEPLLLALLGGGGAVAIVGYCDDRYRLPAGVRLAVHVLAALWALVSLGACRRC